MRILASIVLGVMLVIGSDAIPQTAGTQIPEREVEAKLRIVADLSQYKMPFMSRPKAFVVPAEWIKNQFCGDFRPCPVIGLFMNNRPNEVFISDEVSADRRDEVLVHELVHWFQLRAGWSQDTCEYTTAEEAEAHTVGYLYVLVYKKRPTRGFWIPNLRCSDSN